MTVRKADIFVIIYDMVNMASDQFTNPRLVASYDALNALGKDRDFWVAEMEKLSPKTIIDLGCGTGLLTCDLAARGYEMIGVEPSGAMLELAKQKPYAGKIKWIEGGYEKFEGLKADVVLMTSHVAQFFLEDKEWQFMLNASYKALNSDGYIIFDSRQHREKSFQSWPTANTRRTVHDSADGDIEWWCNLLETKERNARYELHYRFLRTDEEVTSTDTLIFRSKEELVQSLKNAGFMVEKIYGDWDGSLLSDSSPEMIFVAAKKDQG